MDNNTNQVKPGDLLGNPSCAGKVALVTGAAGSGLGRSIALTLAREGAQVVVNYRSHQANAVEVVSAIQRNGGSAIKLQSVLSYMFNF